MRDSVAVRSRIRHGFFSDARHNNAPAGTWPNTLSSEAECLFGAAKGLQHYPSFCCALGRSRVNAPPQPSLFSGTGQRKYLCGGEWRRFLEAAAQADSDTRAFCRLLAFTGCRLSEALELTVDRLDPEAGHVVFRTLKRRRLTYRAVPVPVGVMKELQRLSRGRPSTARLWSWCRQTGWRRVRAVMDAAGIAGVHASPKGLRHGYGILNAEESVPAPLTSRWMGHARLETTAIYQQVVGQEEHAFADRIWQRLPNCD